MTSRQRDSRGFKTGNPLDTGRLNRHGFCSVATSQSAMRFESLVKAWNVYIARRRDPDDGGNVEARADIDTGGEAMNDRQPGRLRGDLDFDMVCILIQVEEEHSDLTNFLNGAA